jgi:pentatricopeptide repeat protein
MKLIQRGQEAYMDVTKKGFEDDRFVINALIYMYAKCCSFGEATWILETWYPAERASWNALMTGFSEEGLGDQVLECFERMERQGISADVVTLVCCLKACGMIKDADLGRELHAAIIMKNLEGDAFLSNTLLDMYAKLGLLSEARDIFDKLSIQSSSSWTSLISGYAERGLCDEAVDCFDRMQSEGGVSVDILPWNALILGYAEREDDDKPFKIFSAMQEQGILPDKASFLNLLKACSSKSSVKRGEHVHAQMCLTRSEGDPFQLTALLDMYSKCGCMADARRVFDSIPDKDLIAWNALIMGYGRQGEIEDALDSFEIMLDQNVKPNEATFVNVLSVCNHAGLVQKGQMYFEAMSRDHGLTPSLQHYSCVIDLLSRAGRLEEAMELVNSMPIPPDDVLLNILLSACSKWGNIQVGKQVFERLVSLTDLQSASFAIMSNIYADGSEGD